MILTAAVISEIEQLMSGAHSLKSVFVTLTCQCIGVGNYVVTSQHPQVKSDLQVTFSEVGILFQIPHCRTG